MVDETLRHELLAMRAEDARVRQELLDAGELGGSYVPRMEAVHVKNAARLREIIAVHGWPAADLAGDDGAEAAWLIAQHAIGEPYFQRQAVNLLGECASQGRVPAWQTAYLEDRIAMQEGRPQRYGTQWLDDPYDGLVRPWKLVDPNRVNDFRAQVGLGPLRPIPKPGQELSPDQRQGILDSQRWWTEWLASKGWRRGSAR
jgi:hypothetical protein